MPTLSDDDSSPGTGETLPAPSKPSSAAYEETLRASGAAQAGGLVKKIGHYQLVRQIGKGGFGLVYEALDMRLKRCVAIKVMRSGEDASADEVRRFRLEAESAAKLKHPNIVPIHDVGRFEDVEYFSMDFVEGVTLGEWLRQKERTYRERAAMIEKVARAIHHAHEKGVIHRDIKPGNVMVDAAGEPHVMDFGLARSVESGKGVTVSGAALGTPAYMPPEQAEGRHSDVGPCSDVWSLGAVLYEALTGRPPFMGERVLQIVRAVVHEEPLPPRKADRSIPSDLETICLKCLEKATAKRYASAESLAADLQRWLKNEPILARPASAVERIVKWAKRRPAGAALIAVSTLAVAGLAGGGLWYNGRLLAALDTARQNEEKAVRNEATAKQNERAARTAQDAERKERERAELAFVAARDREGDALVASGHPLDALPAYTEAWDKLERMGRSTLSPRVGLLKLAEDYPAPLATFRHRKEVFAVAISPDGRKVLSGGRDSALKLWHLPTGKEVKTFLGHKGSVLSIAFLPGGKQALSGSFDKTLKLWDLETGKTVRTFSGHSAEVLSVAVSADGTQALSGSYDKTLKLWDLSTGNELKTLRGHGAEITSVAMSPDGKQALSGSHDMTVKLWDLAAGSELTTHRGYANWIRSVAFSPDGKYALAGSDDGVLKLWELSTGKELNPLGNGIKFASVAKFLPGGKQALSASLDNSLQLWDVATGNELVRFCGHTRFVTSVTISHDGEYAVTGSHDETLKVWKLSKGRDVTLLNGTRHPHLAMSAAFSPDGKLALTAGYGRRVILWDLATGAELNTFVGHSGEIGSVAFSPDGKQVLSGGYDAKLKLWDVFNARELKTFSGHSNIVRSVAFSSDGKQALSGSLDKSIKLWNLSTGENSSTLHKHSDQVTSVAFSPDGERVLSGSIDKTVRLWNLAARTERILGEHMFGVCNVVFSADGKYGLSGGEDGTLRHWDLSSGTNVKMFGSRVDNGYRVAISPDGTQAFTGGGDGILTLWDLSTGKAVKTITAHTCMIWTLALSPDGEQALSAGLDAIIKYWDFTRPRRYREFENSLPKAREAIQTNENDGEALKTLGEWYAFRGSNDWAVELLERARSNGGNVSPLVLARCYWLLSNDARAPNEKRAEFRAAAAKESQRELARLKALPKPQELKTAHIRESEEFYLSLCLQAVTRGMQNTPLNEK